jgi:hypothetical protein
MRRKHPPRESIRNIARIAMRRNAIFEPRTRCNTSRIIQSRRPIKIRIRPLPALIDAVGQPCAIVGAASTFTDHLVDVGRRAGRLDEPIFVTSVIAVMVLHEARVADAEVGCWRAVVKLVMVLRGEACS